jgi:hypothetical protein
MKEGFLSKPEESRFSVANHVAFHTTSLAICVRNESIIDSPVLILDYNTAVE